jgi:hypothetical protein
LDFELFSQRRGRPWNHVPGARILLQRLRDISLAIGLGLAQF